jgi:nucleoside-diphosphate-sugar epimerase
MPNQSLFQLLEMIRRGLFFYIGKSGALVNYAYSDDVVEALIMCATNNRALGNLYILSQSIEIEKMVDSCLLGFNVTKKPFRFPEWLVRRIAQIFGWLPGFPLKISRINALTRNCYYDSNKIEEDLGFEFMCSLEIRFTKFAKSLNNG